MNFSDYQKKSRKTAIYPNRGKNFIYPTLGISGESGEVAEKIKKVIRDNNGKITEKERLEIEKELGDILWYVSQLATELKLSLEKIAQKNLEKLSDRQKRGVLHGKGDNR